MSNTKKILIINGHPDAESYCFGLAAAYKKGALSSGAEVKEITIRDLDFNPNLQYGYRKRTALEPDLLEAWDKIKWAEHLVWVYPVWWGSLPAMLKGFIDRLFLPGFAFKKHEGSMVKWDKLLAGRTARVISTLDQPNWFYILFNGSPSHKAMRRLTMNFVGVKSVKFTTVAPIRLSTMDFRKKWLRRVEQLGLSNK